MSHQASFTLLFDAFEDAVAEFEGSTIAALQQGTPAEYKYGICLLLRDTEVTVTITDGDHVAATFGGRGVNFTFNDKISYYLADFPTREEAYREIATTMVNDIVTHIAWSLPKADATVDLPI